MDVELRQMNKIPVSKRCLFCQHNITLMVVPAEYERWKSGVHAQNALVSLSDGERELLISGTCEACFDEMFATPT